MKPTNCTKHTNNRLGGGVFSATTAGIIVRGHRFKTTWLALSIRAFAALDQSQKSEWARCNARSRGGLGRVRNAFKEAVPEIYKHGLAADRCVSAAWAQSCWYNGDYGLKQRGYYGTPYGGGPQYSSGGGDQYGYGPAYSYAKQAPE